MLQGDVAPGAFAARFPIIDGLLAIDKNAQAIPLSDDLHREPAVGRPRRHSSLHQPVQTAGLIRITFDVDLRFKATRYAGSLAGAEEDAAVAALVDLGLDPQLKITVVIAAGIEVTLVACAGDGAIDDFPVAGAALD